MANSSDTLISQFSEWRTVQRRQIIELKSIYDFSALRDIDASVNGGTVINNGVEYELDSGTNANGVAELRSAERIRYSPGNEGEIGVGPRLERLPTGGERVLWGAADDNDGMLFGVDETGLFVEVERSGTVQNTIRVGKWTDNDLSRVDLTKGNIFQITYSWYGYGTLKFEIVLADPQNGNVQSKLVGHRYVETSGQTSLANPNLPITVRVENGGETTGLTCFVAGRQASIIGSFEPNRRINLERRTGVTVGTTGYTHLISGRKKASRVNTSVKLDDVVVITDQSLLIEVRTDMDITTNNFGTPTRTTAKETAVETSVNETINTDPSGEIIDGDLAFGGGKNNSVGSGGSELVNFDWIEQKPVSVIATSIGGSDATVDIIFRWREEW